METAWVRDRLVASDPGHVRLLMAARATATVAASLGILVGVAKALSLPLTVPILGAALGMTWIVSVNDPNPRDQRITHLLLWFPAAAGVVLGAYTAHDRILSDGIFVLLLSASFWARRYGSRAIPMGFIGVFAYFFALFLQAEVTLTPWLLLALAVTDGCGYLFRFAIFRDSPDHTVENGLGGLRARLRLITGVLSRASAQGEWPPKLRRRLEHYRYRLNEQGVLLDDVLRTSDPAESRALRIALMDVEVAASALIDRAVRNPCDPALRENLHELGGEVRALSVESHEHPVVTSTWVPRSNFRAGVLPQGLRIDPWTRQAVQVLAASAAAIAAGEFISPQRWYWAVLAAFIVFSGTTSLSETLTKAWSRVAGTALGILAGVAAVHFVNGHKPAEYALLFFSLFIGVYAFRISYGTMIFCITIVLAVLYALTGRFSDALLVTRLVETLTGAAIGGIAATLILPIRTSTVLRSVGTEALLRLRSAVHAATAHRLGEDGTTTDPLDALRNFDESMQTLRAQVAPLSVSRMFAQPSPSRIRLAMLATAGYYARVLASQDGAAPGDPLLRTARERLDATIDAALARIQGRPSDVPPPPLQPPPRNDPAVGAVTQIERAVRHFAESYT